MIFAENSNNDQSEFDTIVGCIEDIVIGEKFQDLQVQTIVNAIIRIKDKLMFEYFSNQFHIFLLLLLSEYQESLIGSNCEEFDENSEENKLIYMDIFQVRRNKLVRYLNYKTTFVKRKIFMTHSTITNF